VSILKYLIQCHDIDLSYKDNEALIFASNFDNVEMIDLCVNDSRVNPAARRNFAIQIAATLGNLSIVRRLIDIHAVRDSHSISIAMECARRKRQIHVIRYLKELGFENTLEDDMERMRELMGNKWV
jgi:hypothetical protein